MTKMMKTNSLMLQKVHCGECNVTFSVRVGHEQSDIETHAISCLKSDIG